MANSRQRARNRGKDAERQVARHLGGQRVGPTGKNTADVEHPLFIIEVKNAKAMPESLRALLQDLGRKRKKDDDRIPLLVYKRPEWRTYLVTLALKDFEDLCGNLEDKEK